MAERGKKGKSHSKPKEKETVELEYFDSMVRAADKIETFINSLDSLNSEIAYIHLAKEGMFMSDRSSSDNCSERQIIAFKKRYFARYSIINLYGIQLEVSRPTDIVTKLRRLGKTKLLSLEIFITGNSKSEGKADKYEQEPSIRFVVSCNDGIRMTIFPRVTKFVKLLFHPAFNFQAKVEPPSESSMGSEQTKAPEADGITLQHHLKSLVEKKESMEVFFSSKASNLSDKGLYGGIVDVDFRLTVHFNQLKAVFQKTEKSHQRVELDESCIQECSTEKLVEEYGGSLVISFSATTIFKMAKMCRKSKKQQPESIIFCKPSFDNSLASTNLIMEFSSEKQDITYIAQIDAGLAPLLDKKERRNPLSETPDKGLRGSDGPDGQRVAESRPKMDAEAPLQPPTSQRIVEEGTYKVKEDEEEQNQQEIVFVPVEKVSNKKGEGSWTLSQMDQPPKVVKTNQPSLSSKNSQASRSLDFTGGPRRSRRTSGSVEYSNEEIKKIFTHYFEELYKDKSTIDSMQNIRWEDRMWAELDEQITD